MILAGDIGGTNARLALFNPKIQIEKKYKCKEYNGLKEIVQEFLQENQIQIDRACFGVAGPVRDNVCRATNLPWVVDGNELARELKIAQVFVLNDLEANAHGIGVLKANELVVLNEGVPQKGNRALISAGTGLGEAGLIWDGTKYRPFACEGGHCDFAPRSDEEIGLLRFLKEKIGHVSYERVLSGPGLFSIYEYLLAAGKIEAEPLVQETADAAATISHLALQGKKGCLEVVDRFVSIYGAEAGNVALKFLAFGGVYIGGGIAPKLLERLKVGSFVHSFCDKGRFRDLLSSIPIYVILNEDTALLGAAAFARGAA